MITQENLPKMLLLLGFEVKNDIYTKYFPATNYNLQVNFQKKEIIYPEKSGLIINERQTCNFSSNENFVVFECVHRLLEKGYKPEHIELEPKWKVGHGASGGRADILVRNQENKPLLIIECKTSGNEFKKAWKETQQDGGQLFSYAQQIQETEFLALYASDFEEKTEKIEEEINGEKISKTLLFQQIIISQEIISHKDNKEVLEQDKTQKPFKDAKNVKERYEIWKNTYKLESVQSGIFEKSILPYNIGKNTYNLEEDTHNLTSVTKKGLYHDFRTLLRKHNVSRRENAFDVLVNLFLCKIIDEKENKDDLKFYWKGIAYDNYYDLVDRLQELYQVGMKKFLKEDILYVSNKEIDEAFWTTKSGKNATKKRIKEIFRELKFYKGLDFEFIKVHNAKGFDKNAKILIDIVKMWQKVRLTSQDQNQFLGDMFEYFLDNGIKQHEGQFFTPIPICKFVIASLPLAKKTKEKSEPLKVIDYACGSGHFLTEYATAIQKLIKEFKNNDTREYYQNIFGIEKEDRLAKVATVSACMHGQNEINVIDADALASHEHLKKQSFDVLIANPPFAVDDFLETLAQEDEKEANTYTLFENANLGTNNIQCFFLERAKQLLAPNAVAGIIVPTSILSNGDEMHTKTREILLKYFDFISIVELGSGTFGKTGTNTVVLFLRRKAQKPEQAEHFWDRVEEYFENAQEEIESNGGVYQDLSVLKKYCQHIEIPFEDYKTFLMLSTLGGFETLQAFDLFKDYKNAFDKKTEIINLKKNHSFLKKDKTEQQQELNQRLIKYMHEIEKQKFYFFMLANHNTQNVLVVKSPQDNKEQKQFLGYEWSNAKGSEGIIYNGGDTVYQINTPMFDPNNYENPDKISFLIQQNFLEKTYKVSENLIGLTPFCNYTPLIDLLDFSRTDFNKSISLNQKKKINIESKWELVRIGEIIEYLPKSKRKAGDGLDKGTYPFFTSSQIQNKYFEINDYQQEAIILGTGGNASIHIANNFSTSADVFVIFSKNICKNGYLFYFFQNNINMLEDGFKGVGLKHLSKDYLENIKIPLPPLDIQQKIVNECEAIDQATQNAKNEVENAKREIEEKINEVFGNDTIKKDKIENLSVLLKRGKSTKYGNSDIQVIKSGQARGIKTFDFSERFFTTSDFIIDERKLQKGDLLINSTGVGTAGRVTLFELEGNFVADSHITIFRPKDEIISLFALHCFIYIGFKNIEKMAKGSTGQIELSLSIIGDIKIPVPPLSIQETLVSEIELLEKKISENEEIIKKAPEAKKAVLEKYL